MADQRDYQFRRRDLRGGRPVAAQYLFGEHAPVPQSAEGGIGGLAS